MVRRVLLVSVLSSSLLIACGGSSSIPKPASSPGPEASQGVREAASVREQPATLTSPVVGAEEPSDETHSEVALAPLPARTKVLHVGDSFAGALGLPLGKLFEAAGVSSILKHTDASYLTDWAWDGNLQKYIWKYNPDLIVITLGANELEIQDPEARAKTIKKLIGTVGNRPCAWVAIPLWAGPKNGLLEVIQKNASPCVYVDTNRLMDVAAMPRIRDGIHPTESAREEWARVVLDWLQRHRRAEAGRPWSLQPESTE